MQKKILSAFFLAVFNRYGSISCNPKAKTESLVLAQTFGFIFAKPLHSVSHMVTYRADPDVGRNKNLCFGGSVVVVVGGGSLHNSEGRLRINQT